MRAVSSVASPTLEFSAGPHSSHVADVESGAEDVVEVSTSDDVTTKKSALRLFYPQTYRREVALLTLF